MKSIAIFMLVGLSLFSNGHCDLDTGLQTLDECVLNTLQGSPGMVLELLNPLCSIRSGENSADEGTLTALKNKLGSTLKSINCPLTKELYNTVEPTADSLTRTSDILMQQILGTGLGQDVINAVCRLVNGLLNGCAKKIVSGLTGSAQDLTGTLMGVTDTAKNRNQDKNGQTKCTKTLTLHAKADENAEYKDERLVHALANELKLQGRYKAPRVLLVYTSKTQDLVALDTVHTAWNPNTTEHTASCKAR
ncbi:uncharacterized protein [Eleutherodactylus coqui]|uniref:uncharacterized protein n=1 Tax=Eleutherodactylus coqui TaxID=57060 RepID=UPI003462DAD1